MAIGTAEVTLEEIEAEPGEDGVQKVLSALRKKGAPIDEREGKLASSTDYLWAGNKTGSGYMYHWSPKEVQTPTQA